VLVRDGWLGRWTVSPRQERATIVNANERVTDLGVGQRAVEIRSSKRVPFGFVATVAAKSVQVEDGWVHALAFSGFDDQHVADALLAGGYSVEGDRVTLAGAGIVCHGNGDHVLVGSGTQLCESVGLEAAGVGYQDELRAGEHQCPCALGKHPVVADHRSHDDLARGCVQHTYREPVAGGERGLAFAERAGMDLGVGQHDGTVSVDQRHGIAWQARPFLQVGQGDGHLQLARQVPEVADVRRVSGEGKALPDLFRW
jgi:hypothetical protein